MKYYKDKTVYITGGSSGLGFKAASILAGMGARVVIFARNSKRLDQAVSQLNEMASGNGRVKGYVLDVSDHKKTESVMKEAVKEIGSPDILIANAGIGSSRYLDDMPFEEFDQVMKVNLYGVRNAIAALLPELKGRRGRIAVVASTAGILPLIGYTAYGTSKFAVIGFVECLRGELKKQGVNMTLFCPPEMDTPLVDEEAKTISAPARMLKSMGGNQKLDRAARILLKAIQGKKFRVIPGWYTRFAVLLHEITGGWFTRFMTDMVVRFSRE